MIAKEILIRHMENGGQIFRDNHDKNDRFFYKLEDGKLMCRCNELGGWHDTIAELRWDSDKLEIATLDYDYSYWREPKLIEKKLPVLEETTGHKTIEKGEVLEVFE
tara:strand:+ start:160 stop:477 length:318 start_codon:yes stop_codon:yes gene_type:complete